MSESRPERFSGGGAPSAGGPATAHFQYLDLAKLLPPASLAWSTLPACPPPLCSNQLDDWRELHCGGAGITWLLAAPLSSCSRHSSRRSSSSGGSSCSDNGSCLAGAVLVGGRSPGPTVDAQWLQEWACEMGRLIRHASVQLMEVGVGRGEGRASVWVGG